MSELSYQKTIGKPGDQSFVRAGVTKDGRLDFEMSSFDQSLPHGVLVQLADAWAAAIWETVNDHVALERRKGA